MRTVFLILAMLCAAPAFLGAQAPAPAKAPSSSELGERLDGLRKDRINDKLEMDMFRDAYNTDMDLLSAVLLVLLLVFGALFLIAFRDLRALKARELEAAGAFSRLESAEKALEETRQGWQAGLAALAQRLDALDQSLKKLQPEDLPQMPVQAAAAPALAPAAPALAAAPKARTRSKASAAGKAGKKPASAPKKKARRAR